MLKSFNKLWYILTRSEKEKAVVVLFMVIVMAIIEAAGVLSIMPFLAVLSRPSVVSDNKLLHYIYNFFSFESQIHFIIVLGVASILLVMLSSILKIITNHALNRFANLQRHYFSSRLLATYLNQPYSFFLQRNSSELSKNILSEVDQLLGDVMQPLMQLIAQGVVVFGMMVILFAYDPTIAALTLLIIGSLYFCIYQSVRSKLYQIGKERHDANEDRFKACQEALSGIKDVKITNSTQQYMEKFSKSSRLLSRHIAASDTLSQIPLFLVEATGYSCLIVLAIFLIFKNSDIAHVLPVLGLYGFAAYRMLPAAQIIYRAMARLRFADIALNNIYNDFLLSDTENKKSLEYFNSLKPIREIKLKNVSFSYPSQPDKPIIDNFNLTIPVNNSIGIIGKSGSGKSTIMDILLGLLSPSTGNLIIDDKIINSDNVMSWHRAIGYVPQHIYLADASVAENIAFGIPKDQIDMNAVKRAAETAQAHNFISSLKFGYNTDIGERGILLSGGQRQRIGIARALYRNPSVLFMDEATSALDHETETAVNQAIHELSGKKTMIIIAHRESAVAKCDTIIDLNR